MQQGKRTSEFAFFVREVAILFDFLAVLLVNTIHAYMSYGIHLLVLKQLIFIMLCSHENIAAIV